MDFIEARIRVNNRTNHYLHLLQTKFGLRNAAQVAAFLGVSRVAVGRWFYGEQHLSDDVALKLANLLDLNPELLLAEMQAERTKGPVHDAWVSLVGKLRAAGVAATVILGLSISSMMVPTHSEAGVQYRPSPPQS